MQCNALDRWTNRPNDQPTNRLSGILSGVQVNKKKEKYFEFRLKSAKKTKTLRRLITELALSFFLNPQWVYEEPELPLKQLEIHVYSKYVKD